MRAYEEYKRELNDELVRRKMRAEELDDGAGSKPVPMDEDSVIEVLHGHKFKFSVPDYEEYLKESRSICEKVMRVTEFNLSTALSAIQTHFASVVEPQYKSIFIMRLI